MSRQEELQQLADRIRQLRIAQGYATAADFAQAHDIPLDLYLQYEEGYDIDMLSLFSLIHKFSITPEAFFSRGFTQDINS